MLTNLLQPFRLNEKERHIFTKTLELGNQAASQIARVLELPRNTSRDLLDRLVKKGLLVRTRKGNTHYYSVDTTANIIRSLEIRKKKLTGQLDLEIDFLKKYGNELQPNKLFPGRPKITFYDGEDGLRRVYEDTLTSKEQIRAFASLPSMYHTLPDYFPEYFKRRAKKKIRIRAIFPDSKEARERQKHDAQELRESRIVPADKFFWTPEINIYDDKCIIISWKEKIAVMIESQEISEAMKAIFELAWMGV